MATALTERQRLERTFGRVRWLGVAALVVLALAAGPGQWLVWIPALVLTAGNTLIWRAYRWTGSLRAERRLGVMAVTLDTVVAWSAAALADSALLYAAFVLVAAEASVRYAPAKGLAVSVMLIAALASAMAVQAGSGTPFDPGLLGFWSAVILLIGAMVGVTVREVYRVRPVERIEVPVERDAGAPPQRILEVTPEMLRELTRRERQVLELIAQGHSNAQIAEALSIEAKTVKNHINNIYSKLRLHSRYEAIASALGHRAATDS